MAGGEPIVRAYYKHDPTEYDFSSEHLPALYLFPTGSARDPRNEAEDWRLKATKIRVFWVIPRVDQFVQAAWGVTLEAIADLIDDAIELGRDPCWVLEGDTEPTAASEGSVVLRHAGLVSMQAGRWLPTNIAIKPFTDAFDPNSNLFPALQTEIVVERLSKRFYGADRGGVAGSAPAAPAELQATISVEGFVVAEARFLAGYSMLYLQDRSASQTIGTAPAKLTDFSGSGTSHGIAPDAAGGTLTIRDAGVYQVSASLACEGTADRVVQVRCRKNNVEQAGVGSSGKLTSGRIAIAFAPAPVQCQAGDVLSLYVEASADATSFVPVDGVFSATRIH